MIPIIIVSLITILGACLRFYNLGWHTLWFDEIHSLHLETYANSIFEIPQLLTKYYLSEPPLFHITQYIFLYFGKDEFWVRLGPCLMGILTIPILYIYVDSFLKDKVIAIFASFFLALSPYHIYYSQEARGYSQFLLCSILSFHFFFLAVKKGGIKFWILYSFFTLLTLFTHYLSAFMIFSQCCLLFYRKPPVYNSNYHSVWKQLAVSFIGMFLLYLFWLPSMIIQRKMANYNISSPVFSLRIIFSTIKDILGFHEYAVIVILCIIAIAIIRDFKSRSKIGYYIIFLWLICFPITAEYIFITSNIKSFFNPRYVIFILPILISLILFSLSSIIDMISNYLSYLKIGSYIVVFFLIIFFSIPPLLKYYKTDKHPWREVVLFLQDNTGNQDIILAEPSFYLPSILYYLKVTDYLAHNKTVSLSRGRDIHLGHLSEISNLDILLSQNIGIWCITESAFAFNCSNKGMRLIKEFEGLISNVMIYANDRVFNTISLKS